MKKFFKFLKKHRKDLILSILLLSLIYRAWYLLSQFTIRSDGFVYMLSTSQREYWSSKPLPITGIQAGGYMVASVLRKIFGANIQLYYWFELSVLLLIAFVFYVAVRIITKNSFVAFAAALIASSSYFGIFDTVATHCFCFSFERFYIIPFLLTSFIFLHLFLEYKKQKYYFYSILFYALGVGLGYVNLLITPFFLLYPFFYVFLQKGKFRKRLKGLLFMLPFLLLSILFVTIHMVRDGGISPHQWTFIGFLLQPEKYLYLKKIALQFVYWSQYLTLFKNFAQNPNLDPVSYIIDQRIAGSYIVLVISTYICAAYVIYKFLPKQRPMLFTLVFSIPIIFYLNAYLGQYDMLNWSGPSRYLYLPTFLLAIFWAYFIWAVFWRKKKILIFCGILLLALYYKVNLELIHSDSRQSIKWAIPTRSIYNYVISSRRKLTPNTLVIVTYPEFGSQEATFFTEQIGKGSVKYTTDNNLVNAIPWQEAASASAKVIKVNYDATCKCVIETKLK